VDIRRRHVNLVLVEEEAAGEKGEKGKGEK
jgi:hypothetical protein